VGVLILAWIAWSMIKRKAVAIVCSPARQHAPRSSCGKAGPPQPRDHRPGRAVWWHALLQSTGNATN